jgi:inosine-uridine nucleoside N-ribohydrolase
MRKELTLKRNTKKMKFIHYLKKIHEKRKKKNKRINYIAIGPLT